MNEYKKYIIENNQRKIDGLHPKPIESGALLKQIIKQIINLEHKNRQESIKFLIYNVTPGTTSAAKIKANFLKDIINEKVLIDEISIDLAFELLSHMKGGPSIDVLLDIALKNNSQKSLKAAEVLKTQVFLYESDMNRLASSFSDGNLIARDILVSYSKAEFFTKLPPVPKEIEVITFVAGVGDISTDFLSPGSDAHSRSDRELHGKSIFEHNTEKQNELLNLGLKHPEKSIMLVAEKGTMGVGSSRMSGVNNVALWIGKQTSPYVPFVNFAPLVAGTNGISPIFLTTVSVTGGIGLDLKNWIKKRDINGNVVFDSKGEPVLKQLYSVDTGTILTINTQSKKLYKDKKEIADVSDAFTPQKLEFIRSGGSYAIVFGKKLQSFAASVLNVKMPQVYAQSKEIYNAGRGLTAVEKIFNKNLIGSTNKDFLNAGSDVRVKVNIVGSQDTTGLMTSQELEAMAAKTISPIIDGAYQSGCHTASVWDLKSQQNIPKLMKFMSDFGLITARDPKGKYHPMTDVIHKVLNDLTVDDWSIIIGGDSHTRMIKKKEKKLENQQEYLI